MQNMISGLLVYFDGGTTLHSVRRVAPFYHFFLYTFPVHRLLQLVQLSHYVKQVNPPKFYLQHLVSRFYLSSLQTGTKCKIWLNSLGSFLSWENCICSIIDISPTSYQTGDYILLKSIIKYLQDYNLNLEK